MKVSIYLHKEIYNTLKMFGDLNDVINKVLEAGAQGNFDVTDKPNSIDRIGAKRFNVTITEPDYLGLLEIYPINSSKISLRRLLYWFVENEIYNELGWEPVDNYVDDIKEQITKKINNISSDVIKLKTKIRLKLDEEYCEKCDTILELLNSLEDQINEVQQFNDIIV